MPADLLVEEPPVDAIVARIVEAFAPQRIVLFGSRARGDHRFDSDLDLFVEMESDLRRPERATAIGELFGLRSWSMDVVVFTPEEVRRLRGTHGTLMDSIERDGITLHTA